MTDVVAPEDGAPLVQLDPPSPPPSPLASEPVKPLICEVGGGGLILPLFGDAEQRLPNGLRTGLYLAGLLWTFLGVAIVADIFMAAIEEITSKTKAVTSKDDKGESKTYYVQVWNGTVANLTLMALGSSAPEILLSVIEVTTNNFFSGALGPSTIVGSAAFNLMVILAVCVLSIPSPEGRTIEQFGVFGITATFSVLAYVWLVVILMISTPDIVTPAEGCITFALFPALVCMAYLMDVGWCARKRANIGGYVIGVAGSIIPTATELARIVAEIKNRFPGQNINQEVLGRLVSKEAQRRQPKSRAYWRVNATRQMVGGKRVHVSDGDDGNPYAELEELELASEASLAEEAGSKSFISFTAGGKYSVSEGDKEVVVTILRSGNMQHPVEVSYKTVDGTAKADDDYIHVSGVAKFAPGQAAVSVKIPIVDDEEVETDENFYLKLVDAKVPGASVFKRRGRVEIECAMATITVYDDDTGGVFSFEQQKLRVKDTDSEVLVRVLRREGNRGRVTVGYYTSDGSAVNAYDYTHVAGTLTFEDKELVREFRVPLVPTRGYDDKEEEFFVHLADPSPGTQLEKNAAGKEQSRITASVIVVNDSDLRKEVDSIATLLPPINADKVSLGQSKWAHQFTEAVTVRGEGDAPPTASDWILHIVALPWKVLFALCPPTFVADGLACFAVALVLIGVVTAVIGDLAGLLGCTLGIPDEITAITFVALGTSLPDTFASMASAKGEPTADSSIGNVTGSNSVNVFLGLGLPWTIGALYWKVNGRNADWDAKYPELIALYPDGGFAVPAGDLGFSVAVFAVCAVFTLLTIVARRKAFKAELGGPPVTKYATAIFFVLLWFAYIALSAMKTLGMVG